MSHVGSPALQPGARGTQCRLRVYARVAHEGLYQESEE
jgi:hypothetical protein